MAFIRSSGSASSRSDVAGIKSHLVLLLAGSVLAATLVVAGCGGGSNGQVPTTGGSGGVTASAAYVGRAACATCHADVDTQYTNCAMSKDFTSQDGRAGCMNCHSTGYGLGGFVSLASTPAMANVTCEACHGPGGAHAAAPSAVVLPKITDSRGSCWDCHSATYQLLRHNPGPAYDIDLVATIANKVSGPSHCQALYLYGAQAVDQPVTPSPHASISNNCVTCHLNPNQGTIQLAEVGADPIHGLNSLAPDLPSCIPCHGSESATKTLYDDHKTKIVNELIALGGASAGAPDKKCGGGMFAAFVTRHGINIATNTTAQQADPFVAAYKAARWNYIYVINDKSFGTHNPTLTDAIITQCQSLLSQ